MRLLKKLFGSKSHESVDMDAVKPLSPESESKAKDDYYADLKAQQADREARRDALSEVLGDDDSMSDIECMEAAKRIVQVNPMASIQVVDPGDSVGSAAEGLVDTEDAASAGEVFSGSYKNDGRFADVWTTFAQINPRILKHFVSRAFIGYPACTILGTHEIINPCCAMPGEDAISPGYRLLCASDDHEQDDEHIMREDQWLKKMQAAGDSSGLTKSCTDLSFYTRLYGIGVAIPRVELKDGHTFDEEYDPSFVKPGSFKGFSVVDPQRFTWDFEAETLYDPLSPYYMKPEYVRIYNSSIERIHRSWCVICYYREVGDDLKGTYMWGGVPLSQMLYERVFCADKLANEIVALAMSKRVVVKAGNMEAMIHDPRKANKMIERFNYYRSNRSIAFVEPNENLTQLETSLSDLQPLSAQQYQYAAAIAGIPVTKLLKNVPSGLQATGQYEQDEYEQTLKGIQEQYYRPLITKYYELYIASNYEDRDDLEVEVSFNPIQLPKVSEVQQIASQRASMVCSLLQQSTITVTEARAILKSGESPLFSMLESHTPDELIKIEKLKDPEEQQKMQMKLQQQMGGMGGMPGMGGGIPGAEGGQPGAPDPKFEENKNVFQEALQEVLGGEGGVESQGGTEGGEGGVEEGGQAESVPSETSPEAGGTEQQGAGVFTEALNSFGTGESEEDKQG